MAGDSRNALVDSRYSTDKAIYLYSSSFTMGATSYGATTVTHGLPFTPLVSGSWSLTSDFSVQYEFGSGPFPSTNMNVSLFDQHVVLQGNPYGTFAGANATNIVMNWANSNAAAKTVYYRLYAMEPPSFMSDTNSTVSAGDTAMFNSNYNYMKLYQSYDLVTPTNNTYATAHNLGYIPQAAVWVTETSGRTCPYDSYEVSVDGSVTAYRIVLDSTNLTLTNVSFATNLSARIYLEKNA